VLALSQENSNAGIANGASTLDSVDETVDQTAMSSQTRPLEKADDDDVSSKDDGDGYYDFVFTGDRNEGISYQEMMAQFGSLNVRGEVDNDSHLRD
jgi:hypothetical protein